MLELSCSPMREPPSPSAAGAPQPLALDSRALFPHRPQVLIRHGSETYVLRLTRQGKLILTK